MIFPLELVARFEQHGVPQEVLDRLRPLRRTWLVSADRRF